MKRGNLTCGKWGLLIPAFFSVVCFLAEPACCQLPGVALLVQLRPTEGGVVQPGVGVHHFSPHSAVALTAVPKPGYEFVCWLGDVDDRTATSTVAYLDKPKIIVALFEQIRYEVLPAAGVAFGGRFLPGGPQASGVIPSASPILPAPPLSPTPPPSPVPPPPGPQPPPPAEPSTILLLGVGAAILRRRK
jgi:hypothetical protein